MLSTVVLLIALAHPASLEALPLFKDARRFYAEFEYEKALARFQETLRDPSLTPIEQGAVLTWEALTEAQLGDWSAARAALEDAVARDAGVSLPPRAPPKVVDLLTEVRRRDLAAPTIPQEASAPLTQTTTSPGAPSASFGASGADVATPASAHRGARFPVLMTVGGGVLVLAAGAAVTGAAFAVLAAGKQTEADNEPIAANQTALRAQHDQLGLIANTLFLGGAIAAVVGGTLMIVSPAVGELSE